DRLGIKPLYYHHSARQFCFASTPDAIRELLPDTTLDPVARDLFLALGYIPAPHSIWREIRKLSPGTWLEFDQGVCNTHSYWEVPLPERSSGARQPDLDLIEQILSESIRMHLVADRELGVFLSSGIDSSLIAALATREFPQLKTFTIRFEEPEFDESETATAIARALNTEHHTLTCSTDAAKAMIQQLPEVFTEPFADPSALPTMLLCREARNHIVVALGGDGGDELALGYRHYAKYRRLAPLLNLLSPLAAPLPRDQSSYHPSLLYKIPYLLGVKDKALRTQIISAIGLLPYFSRLYGREFPFDQTPWSRDKRLHELPGELPLAMGELIQYLPDDLLVKTDRASMFFGLELRVPLLDHKVLEHCLGLPLNWRREKRILRTLLGRYLPSELSGGRKQGFSPPIATWLRTIFARDLRMLAESKDFCELTQIRTDRLAQLVREHCDGAC
ncbi:MAG: hypothetical protein D6820_06265, partial [Lentisphaerae bacterium]